MPEIRTQTQTRILPFYKENGLWYADLPEFLAQGLGTKADLLMVDGSDTFLDLLSSQGTRVVVEISTEPFGNQSFHLEKVRTGLNRDLLERIGHAPVDYGAYYLAKSATDPDFQHILWLCPVAEYVFRGEYPENIYISKQ